MQKFDRSANTEDTAMSNDVKKCVVRSVCCSDYYVDNE